jgi:tetratricopeptide (TPR) repeat protein
MDFGLALAAGGDEAGGSGTLVGTPDYMSPEQARGGEIDARSDLYALGIILYELVTGKLPFDAPDMMVAMRRRLEETPKPPIELDPSIPKHLNEIVMRCLAPAPDERFATAAELLHELQVFRGIAPTGIPRRWKWISASLAAMVVAAGGFVTWDILNRPPPVKKTVTLLVADFQNNTGDPLFDNTLEPVFNVALEGASFINAYNRGQARSLAGKVKPGATRLEDGVAMLVAVREGLNVVVTGAIARDGSSYRCSARALDAITGKVIVEEDTKVAAKDQVLAAMPRLAAPIRKALGDPTSESDQRLALETLTATSLEAVHEYASGLDALSAGKFRDAIGLLSKAVERDPDFGMAYTVMASASRNLGQQQEAEKYINEALKHMGRMTERERFRTRAYLYLLTGNHQKCVDEYGALLDKYPSDTGAYTNIGVCYVQLHNIPKAVEAARKAVAILPKRAIYHGNLAMSLAYAGDAEGAAKAAEEALKLGYRNAYLHQAYVGLLRERPDQAAEAYGKFQANNASDAATGLADLAVYEGRFSDAVKMLEKGATEDMAGPKPDRDAAATKYWMLANVQLVRGQKSPALAAARRALELSKSFQARLIAARVYVAFGESAKAKELAAGLASQLQIEPQAYARLIEGEIALQAKDAREAIQIFTDANKLLDTWIGRLDLGKAYLEVGAFPEADSEFDRCIRRRGEALSLFNDLPTYGFFPPAYYYQGRAREGMKIPDFAESYKKYAGIREKATEDPLLVEVRRRIPR